MTPTDSRAHCKPFECAQCGVKLNGDVIAAAPNDARTQRHPDLMRSGRFAIYKSTMIAVKVHDMQTFCRVGTGAWLDP